jgi:hypothetical protein
LGVIVGIILLVFELKQTRDLMRAQTRHDLSSSIVNLLLSIAENPELAHVMVRGDAGGELSPDELYIYETRSRALFRYWENVHYQYRKGLYDPGEFASQRDAWAAYLGTSSGAASAWCGMRREFSPEFRTELDGVLPTTGC